MESQPPPPTFPISIVSRLARGYFHFHVFGSPRRYPSFLVFLGLVSMLCHYCSTIPCIVANLWKEKEKRLWKNESLSQRQGKANMGTISADAISPSHRFQGFTGVCRVCCLYLIYFSLRLMKIYTGRRMLILLCIVWDQRNSSPWRGISTCFLHRWISWIECVCGTFPPVKRKSVILWIFTHSSSTGRQMPCVDI